MTLGAFTETWDDDDDLQLQTYPFTLPAGEQLRIDQFYRACDVAKIWVRVTAEGVVEECAHDRVGTELLWLRWIREDVGGNALIEGLFPGWDILHLSGPLQFILQEGIAPGQPFLVRLSRYVPPRRTYQGDYDDPDWDCELLEVEPWPLARVVKAWRDVEGLPRRIPRLPSNTGKARRKRLARGS